MQSLPLRANATVGCVGASPGKIRGPSKPVAARLLLLPNESQDHARLCGASRMPALSEVPMPSSLQVASSFQTGHVEQESMNPQDASLEFGASEFAQGITHAVAVVKGNEQGNFFSAEPAVGHVLPRMQVERDKW